MAETEETVMWEVVLGPFHSKDEADRWAQKVTRKSNAWILPKVQEVRHLELATRQRDDAETTALVGQREILK